MKFHLDKRTYLITIGVVVVIGAIIIAAIGCIVASSDNNCNGLPDNIPTVQPTVQPTSQPTVQPTVQPTFTGTSVVPVQPDQWIDAPPGYSGKQYSSYEVVDLRTNR